ncbi:hypothetical protein [Fournierella sp.]|uniref:hypothetical protein n=1 Tax=Allofournierella sp. TaxID=1940256 RepID=UPI0025BC2DC0|nr:hypothetical protein [Fournierella sp.]
MVETTRFFFAFVRLSQTIFTLCREFAQFDLQTLRKIAPILKKTCTETAFAVEYLSSTEEHRLIPSLRLPRTGSGCRTRFLRTKAVAGRPAEQFIPARSWGPRISVPVFQKGGGKTLCWKFGTSRWKICRMDV